MFKKYFVLLAIFIAITVLAVVSCDDNPVTPKPDPKPDTTYTPEIIKIDPVLAKSGDIIRLHGLHFGNERGTSYVMFGEFKVGTDNYSLWNDTLIILSVPEEAITGFVKVVVGKLSSNQVYFTVGVEIPAPTISRINPDKAYRGDEVIIDGANFLNDRDTNYILFFGSKLESKYYKSWIGSKIIFYVPEDAEYKKDMVTLFVNGKESNSVAFTVREKEIPKDPPVIDSIKPKTAMAGDTIYIYGSYFTDFRTENNGFVSIGGVKVDETSGYVDWKKELILVIVPKNAQTGKLFVSKEGLKSNEVDFTLGKPVKDPPVIESLSSTNLLPGQTIDVIGKNFGTAQGLSTVVIEGNVLSRNNISLWTDKKITLQVPTNLTPANYKISVVVDDVESNKSTFTIKEVVVPPTYFIETVLITKGTFQMGTDDEEQEMANPKHQVTLTRDFYMSKTEITQSLWKQASASYPDYMNEDKGDNKPATQLTYLAVIQWCNDASKKDKLTPCYTINGNQVTCDFSKNGYRLPTEAEWEYACRAGTTGDTYFSDNVADNAWYGPNSGKHLNDVSKKNPNAWGLYDMYGNAAEWVWDWLEYYDDTPATDPTGPKSFEGNGKVIRGGSCMSVESQLKSWFREDYGGDVDSGLRVRNVGFRVVRNK